jgi:hypothetical protein
MSVVENHRGRTTTGVKLVPLAESATGRGIFWLPLRNPEGFTQSREDAKKTEKLYHERKNTKVFGVERTLF